MIWLHNEMESPQIVILCINVFIFLKKNGMWSTDFKVMDSVTLEVQKADNR